MGQIICIGGGGFSENTTDLGFERYAIKLANQELPSVCFLPTASGDSNNYIVRFYSAFRELRCRPTHLSLFQPHVANLEDFLLRQSVIYVGGGNTKSMLALWRDWKIDNILKTFWERGGVLIGVSAGAICWFDAALTDSFHGSYQLIPGLGFLQGACAPHFDSEAGRQSAFSTHLSGSEMIGYGIEDNTALHFSGHSLVAVLGQANKKAIKIENRDGKICSETLPVSFVA